MRWKAGSSGSRISASSCRRETDIGQLGDTGWLPRLWGTHSAALGARHMLERRKKNTCPARFPKRAAPSTPLVGPAVHLYPSRCAVQVVLHVQGIIPQNYTKTSPSWRISPPIIPLPAALIMNRRLPGSKKGPEGPFLTNLMGRNPSSLPLI